MRIIDIVVTLKVSSASFGAAIGHRSAVVLQSLVYEERLELQDLV